MDFFDGIKKAIGYTSPEEMHRREIEEIKKKHLAHKLRRSNSIFVKKQKAPSCIAMHQVKLFDIANNAQPKVDDKW